MCVPKCYRTHHLVCREAKGKYWRYTFYSNVNVKHCIIIIRNVLNESVEFLGEMEKMLIKRKLYQWYIR